MLTFATVAGHLLKKINLTGATIFLQNVKSIYKVLVCITKNSIAKCVQNMQPVVQIKKLHLILLVFNNNHHNR